MSVIRPEISALELSGIGKIAIGALDDPEVIPLWFGESDIVTPDFIRDAAKAAMDAGKTFYSYTRGHTALRQALHRYHRRIYGIDLDLDAVAAAVGAKTRAVYVNSPSNPTGWIMREDEGRALLELCRRHGLGLISDEVYHRNVFDGPDPAPSFVTLAEPEEPVFVLNGFSKAWAMTGWRLGWMITPSGMAETMAVLAECNNTGSTAFAQYGGVAALDDGEPFVAEFVARCRRNRDAMMAILGSHPRVRLAAPAGAFYAFPRIEGIGDGLAFCRRVLAEAKVGMAPGYTFGPGNEAHFRLCFARRTEEVEEAARRIVQVIDRGV